MNDMENAVNSEPTDGNGIDVGQPVTRKKRRPFRIVSKPFSGKLWPRDDANKSLQGSISRVEESEDNYQEWEIAIFRRDLVHVNNCLRCIKAIFQGVSPNPGESGHFKVTKHVANVSGDDVVSYLVVKTFMKEGEEQRRTIEVKTVDECQAFIDVVERLRVAFFLAEDAGRLVKLGFVSFTEPTS